MSLPANLLVLSGLSKSYSARVLTDVDFQLRTGEVHALVGENGAGKSTLGRIIAGLVRADAGRMEFRGAAYSPRNKIEAEQRGVRMVMQELNLIPNLTVAENVFFGRMPHRWGWLQSRRMNTEALAILERMGLSDLDPRRQVKTLGMGQQQLIEIAAGISRQCQVLILDEPTAALASPEVERLFTQILKLKAAGVGIIFISHRLEEIQRIADRITVLRDGKMIATRAANEFTIPDIVGLMVGRELDEAQRRAPNKLGSVMLRVQGLSAKPAVQDVHFEARSGEILGFAGLMGSGRTETMRAVFGADRADSGAIYLRGAALPARIRSPRDAVRHGMAFLTEDRKSQGLLLPLPIRANVTLTRLASLSRWPGWIRSQAESAAAKGWATTLNIRCASVEQSVFELSGGNQQKVVLAKWLFRDCDILIFDEPTRGIDVGAKFEIYKLLTELAGKGKAIVLVSSDLKELFAVCDRIVVMSAGRVAGSFSRGEWSEEKIMGAALSGYLEGNSSANNSRTTLVPSR